VILSQFLSGPLSKTGGVVVMAAVIVEGVIGELGLK
jgi:hypothetical protein